MAGASPPLPEERPQQRRRPRLPDAAVDLRPVVAGRARVDARAVVDAAALGVGGAVVEAAEAGEAERVGAHRAGLEGDVEVAAGQAGGAEAGGGGAQREELGVGGGI